MRAVPWPQVGDAITDGEAVIARIGSMFVNEYVVAFELLALLLLVALAGAIVLARDRKQRDRKQSQQEAELSSHRNLA